MQGFVSFVREILIDSGIPKTAIYCERNVQLPGWFRPEKMWDVLVMVDGCLRTFDRRRKAFAYRN